ncbi:MAG: oligosaccharide flippase family protein [Patescibacteria group bacterium]
MFERIKAPLYRLLRSSEKYTKTDMVHFFSANFWLNISRFIAIGSGMALTVAFANLLTPESFGTYKYVLASAGLIAAFSANGLMLSLSRAAAQGNLNIIPTVVRIATLWSIPASIGALTISLWYFSHSNIELGFAFLCIAFTNSISNGIGITKGVWQARGEYKLATIVGLPKMILPAVVILLTILFTKSVFWILLAYFLSNLLVSVFGYFFMLRHLRVKSSSEGAQEAIRYGQQVSLLGIFQLASAQIDQLLLWHFSTPVALATYALAMTPVNEVRNLLGNFLTVLFPKLAIKTKEEAYRTVPLRMKQMFIAALILTIIYILCIPFLFKYLFPKYLESVLVSQVLALTILFQPRAIVDTLFAAHAEMGNRLKILTISQVIDFALALALVPFFGLWGVVWATLLSEAISALMFILVYRQAAKKMQAS